MLKGNIKLIGITGPANSGKSVLSKALQGQFGYYPMNFSGGLKRMIHTLPHLSEEKMQNKEWRERVHPFYGKTPREMMQSLGTDWGRHLVHPDIWVWVAAQKIENKFSVTRNISSYIFDDVRFENEAEWIRNTGGLIVALKRTEVQPIKYHISEAGIAPNVEDYIVRNDRSIEDLCSAAPFLNDLAEQARSRAVA